MKGNRFSHPEGDDDYGQNNCLGDLCFDEFPTEARADDEANIGNSSSQGTAD
jgi:hypothetical protein